MEYLSTRGQAPTVSFEQALLAGLAPDGGLYMPASWPRFTLEQIRGLAGKSFAEVAAFVLAPFTGDTFAPDELQALCNRAFATFSHPAVTPLVQIGDEDWILELFHGPTLAFKDVAMQLLGVMFETVLARRNKSLTIIGATSGDTGGAAIEALKNRDGVTVFILHPEGRISEVQRRIMTTSGADNIHNIAVAGTFDDCQAIVKSLFSDTGFVEQTGLSGVNSINWARIAIQTVYYFTSAVALGAPDRRFSYVVPTGNFGDIFAGFVARQMGLPMKALCAATNQNDIVHRVLSTGAYVPSTVAATSSPSMDIQVASNFERLLFEASGRDSAHVRQLMNQQKQSGSFTLDSPLQDYIGEFFTSEMASEDETSAAMAEHVRHGNMLIDPHTAVGRVVAGKARAARALSGPVITLATAHPAKFPESVTAATGRHPALPSDMHDLMQREESMVTADADVGVVKNLILNSVL